MSSPLTVVMRDITDNKDNITLPQQWGQLNKRLENNALTVAW